MESGVSDFFRQLPVGFIIMFCGSGILLVFAFIYILRERTQRVAAAAAAGPQGESSMPVSPMSEADLDDLPDLDELASAEMVRAAPPRPTGTYSVRLTDGGQTDVVEVLTILRDVAEGGLIIRIGDKAYRNPPAVADADFKRRFHTTLRDLNGAQKPLNVESPPPLPMDDDEAEAVAPSSTAPDDDLPPFDAPPVPPAPPVSPSAAVPPRRAQSFEPAPGDLPKFKMPDNPVKPKRGQRPSQEPIPEINIAASIEAFLQHKLAMTPEFDGRIIHVRPALHGGVTIEVDGKFFESVGEVSDPVVRKFLSTTIEEWQARQ